MRLTPRVVLTPFPLLIYRYTRLVVAVAHVLRLLRYSCALFSCCVRLRRTLVLRLLIYGWLRGCYVLRLICSVPALRAVRFTVTLRFIYGCPVVVTPVLRLRRIWLRWITRGWFWLRVYGYVYLPRFARVTLYHARALYPLHQLVTQLPHGWLPAGYVGLRFVTTLLPVCPTFRAFTLRLDYGFDLDFTVPFGYARPLVGFYVAYHRYVAFARLVTPHVCVTVARYTCAVGFLPQFAFALRV